jgi:2-polyprenyl-6-methoxyphenol hydroxylase-like FAD-dependent oxidoreductase
VVGADGRHSAVRRKVGIELHQTTASTIGGGMLVDDLHAWPQDLIGITTEGDVHFLVFPRPEGRVRLYLLWSAAQQGRFTGADRQQRFLEACRLRTLPYGDAIAAATPAGPCSSSPFNDSWCDRIADEGVVLIGDAAGWNDPIIGQGLSIAARDARMVSDVLLGGTDWSPSGFAGYQAERAERMRRLRIAARLATALRAAFGPEGAAFRQRWTEMAVGDPMLSAPMVAPVIGPERVPAEAFSDANIQRILACRPNGSGQRPGQPLNGGRSARGRDRRTESDVQRTPVSASP